MTTYDYTKQQEETKIIPLDGLSNIGGIGNLIGNIGGISNIGGIGNLIGSMNKIGGGNKFNDADIIVHSILMAGRVNGKTSWWTKPSWWHMYRAIRHSLLWIMGDRSDSHLNNAMTRCYMVVKREQALRKLKGIKLNKEMMEKALYTILEEGEG